MKIGKFAKKHGVSNSTVRYYIELGLLMPEKIGAQFFFQETDNGEMQLIKELKALGYTLKESQKYISTVRLYRENDRSLNERLLVLLEDKQTALLQEKERLDGNLKALGNKLDCLRNSMKAPVDRQIAAETAVPLEFVAMLVCPHCGGKIQFDQASIINIGIVSARLFCNCGYHAEIKSGLLYAGELYDHEQDPDFIQCFFGSYSQTYDDIFFESSAFNSPELMISLHKGFLYLREQLSQLEAGSPVILLPDISCHLLYNFHQHPVLKKSLIIVSTFSPAVIRPILTHLGRLGLKVIYVINQDGILPLPPQSVDLILDYSGMLNFSFFSRSHFLDLFHPYLKDTARIFACTEFYEKGSKSLSNINTAYKFSCPANMSWKTMKDVLHRCKFQLTETEIIGECKEPGPFWEYHHCGDVRQIICYQAKRNETK